MQLVINTNTDFLVQSNQLDQYSCSCILFRLGKLSEISNSFCQEHFNTEFNCNIFTAIFKKKVMELRNIVSFVIIIHVLCSFSGSIKRAYYRRGAVLCLHKSCTLIHPLSRKLLTSKQHFRPSITVTCFEVGNHVYW